MFDIHLRIPKWNWVRHIYLLIYPTTRIKNIVQFEVVKMKSKLYVPYNINFKRRVIQVVVKAVYKFEFGNVKYPFLIFAKKRSNRAYEKNIKLLAIYKIN